MRGLATASLLSLLCSASCAGETELSTTPSFAIATEDGVSVVTLSGLDAETLEGAAGLELSKKDLASTMAVRAEAHGGAAGCVPQRLASSAPLVPPTYPRPQRASPPTSESSAFQLGQD